MKGREYIIGLGILVVLISLSLIGLSFKSKSKIKVSAEEVHQLISKGKHFYEPDKLEKETLSEPNELLIIDLRSPDQFILNHIEGAINIPFQRILDDLSIDYLDSKKRTIIYTENEAKSAEVWVLLTQLGYKNVYVLKGGYSYWKAKIAQQNIMGAITKDSEKPKYDFKKELSPEN